MLVQSRVVQNTTFKYCCFLSVSRVDHQDPKLARVAQEVRWGLEVQWGQEVKWGQEVQWGQGDQDSEHLNLRSKNRIR